MPITAARRSMYRHARLLAHGSPWKQNGAPDRQGSADLDA